MEEGEGSDDPPEEHATWSEGFRAMLEESFWVKFFTLPLWQAGKITVWCKYHHYYKSEKPLLAPSIAGWVEAVSGYWLCLFGVKNRQHQVRWPCSSWVILLPGLSRIPRSKSRGLYRLFLCVCVCVCLCLVTQLCPILCDPMDCSPPGSSLHGILQARILERVALLQGIFLTRDRTHVS